MIFEAFCEANEVGKRLGRVNYVFVANKGKID